MRGLLRNEANSRMIPWWGGLALFVQNRDIQFCKIWWQSLLQGCRTVTPGYGLDFAKRSQLALFVQSGRKD